MSPTSGPAPGGSSGRQLYEEGLRQAAAGRLEPAALALQQAASIDPHSAEILNALGAVLLQRGMCIAAADSFQRALDLIPGSAELHNNLANALQGSGRWPQAIEAYGRAIRLMPNYAAARCNLANLLREVGRFDEALKCLRQAISIQPDLPEAHNILGTVLVKMGDLDQAIASFQRAIVLRPSFPEAASNLGTALKDSGQPGRAVEAFRSALELRQNPYIASNLLLALHCDPSVSPDELTAEHSRWNERYAKPLRTQIPLHANNRDPDRRLRIGYVSPDFCEHPVARFILPLIAGHDRGQVEVFCYSDTRRPDALTQELRGRADAWRDIAGAPDMSVANLIRDDRIDILVDLAMHTAGNRLLVFARQPAPVQVTYLAYCSTTGLETIGYRITDNYLDPPDASEPRFPERPIRLPGSYWCYQPPSVAPAVAELPRERTRGPITFGSLNNYYKVNTEVLAVWSRILRQVAGSRLVLYSKLGCHRDGALEQLARDGVDRERIEFIDRQPLVRYFDQYHRIDIALDPFPYPGGTTTCDALWMGVPVVTLAGRTPHSRSGASILSQIGLADLIAQTPQHYVEIASGLAADVARLADLRASMRDRMRPSALMDSSELARGMEAAYRGIWRSWAHP